MCQTLLVKQFHFTSNNLKTKIQLSILSITSCNFLIKTRNLFYDGECDLHTSIHT